jgi:hypothetical protein
LDLPDWESDTAMDYRVGGVHAHHADHLRSRGYEVIPGEPVDPGDSGLLILCPHLAALDVVSGMSETEAGLDPADAAVTVDPAETFGIWNDDHAEVFTDEELRVSLRPIVYEYHVPAVALRRSAEALRDHDGVDVHMRAFMRDIVEALDAAFDQVNPKWQSWDRYWAKFVVEVDTSPGGTAVCGQCGRLITTDQS